MQDLDKKYYRIGEVAVILQIPASTLRFWEKKFTLIKPRRNAGGTRFYTPADVEKIRMINFLVHEKGLRLEAAEDQLRNNSSGVARRYEAVMRLRDIRGRLEALLAEVDAMRRRR
ncbi:MAG: MerR family transcriptional regulator [Muribaculaceae bacterium]|nr:MerR family transcriptional regulator [Muribaculaceae bacterium]